MEKKYKSEALMVIHQTAEGFYGAGLMSNERIQEYTEGCIAPEHEKKPHINAPAAMVGCL